jgi:DNA-binding beta-propeller fold protein YncE
VHTNRLAGTEKSTTPIRIALSVLCLCLAVGVASALAEGSPETEQGLPTPADITAAIEQGAPGMISMPETDPSAAEELPHRDLDRPEALELLEAVFADQLQSPAGIFDELEVKKFLAPNVAVIAPPEPADQVSLSGDEAQGADAVLLDSTVPLRTESESGDPEAVNLSLERTAGGLEVANPLAGVELPEEMGEGLVLSDPGVTIELEGAPEGRTTSVVDGDIGFAPNVAADTDLIIAPTPTGVETLTHLRSPDAPATQTFNLDLPVGASLEATEDGGAVVRDGGKTLVRVSAPTAIDATGAGVPVAMAVEGSSLTLTVSPDASTRYPVLVDPLYQTYEWEKMPYWKSGICNSSTKTTESNNCMQGEEWRYKYGNPFTMGRFRLENQNFGGAWRPVPLGTPGIFIESSGALTAGERGAMDYTVPRYFTDQEQYGTLPSSYISSMTLSRLDWNAHSSTMSPYMSAGIWDINNAGWIQYYTHEGLNGHGLTDMNFQYTFNNPGNSGGKLAAVTVNATQSTASGNTELYVGYASIQLADTIAPSAGPVTAPTQWVNGTATPIAYAASDSGLGAHSLAASLTPNSWKTLRGCTGVSGDACPRSWKSADAGAPALKYEPSLMPQGYNYLGVVAADPVGNQSAPAYAEVKVDHDAPSLSLSGSLTEQASLGTTASQYSLKYDASDGDDAAAEAFAPTGTAGTGVGKFQRPFGVAIDSSGNAFVVDRECKCVQKYDKAGKFLSQFGTPGAGSGQFSDPRGISVSPTTGNILVPDLVNKNVQIFTPAGALVRKVTYGSFVEPYAVAHTGGDSFWVTDIGSDKVFAFRESDGAYLGQAYGAPADPNGSATGLLSPVGVAADPSTGRMYVTDNGLNRVTVYSIATGKYSHHFGSEGTGNGQFKGPIGVAVAPSGNLLVADDLNNRIQVFQPSGRFLRQFAATGSANNQLKEPRGIALGAGNTLYIADAGNKRLAKWAHADQDPQSGVVKVEIKVDGQVVKAPYNQACAIKNCSTSGEWAYKSSDYSSGTHKVTVVATDGVGLKTTREIDISSVKDTTAPELTTSGLLFSAPGGWVEQMPYFYWAAAKDPGGYGVTSLTFKLDGQVISTVNQSCPNGGCTRSFFSAIDTTEYKGGAHPAELVAIDDAGLVTRKAWTVNVVPEGEIGIVEAEDTLEAVEATSPVNAVGPSQEEAEYYGTAPGLGLQAAPDGFTTTGGEVPTTIPIEADEPVSMQILGEDGLTEECDQSFATPEEEEQVLGPEIFDSEEAELGSSEPCAEEEAEQGDSTGLDTILIEPVTTAATAGPGAMANNNAAIATNTLPNVDTVIRPLYEGILTFKTIRDASAPKAYEWDVALSPGQTIKLLDPAHAVVYYESGDPAFTITAEPAHDAVGTPVATSLSISGATVALNVGHQEKSYVYPVMAGAGWQGGYTSVLIEGPQDEQEVKEEEERIQREIQERLEEEWEGEGEEQSEATVGVAGAQVRVSISSTGPPTPVAFASGPDSGLSDYTTAHKFKFNTCYYGVGSPAIGSLVAWASGGPPERCREWVGEIKLNSMHAVHGWYRSNSILSRVWIKAGNLHCDKYGRDQPARVNCGKRPQTPVASPNELEVFGNYRYPPGNDFFETVGPFSTPSACVTTSGRIKWGDGIEKNEDVVTPTRKGDACDWP